MNQLGGVFINGRPLPNHIRLKVMMQPLLVVVVMVVIKRTWVTMVVTILMRVDDVATGGDHEDIIGDHGAHLHPPQDHRDGRRRCSPLCDQQAAQGQSWLRLQDPQQVKIYRSTYIEYK